MRAREIFLLLLLIVGGVFLTHLYNDWLYWHLDWEEGILFTGDEFSFDETLEVATPPPGKVVIDNTNGDITVVDGETDHITIQMKKRLWKREEADARELANQIHILTETEDGNLKISVDRGQLRERSYHTDFHVSLPVGTPVIVGNTYGTVDISGTGVTEVSNNSGRVIAADIRGDLKLTNRKGGIEAKDIAGRCVIDSRDESVRLSHIEGPVEISHGYGKILLEDIQREVKIRGNDSQIVGHVLRGGLDIENDHEKIELFEIGPAIINTSHGPVEINGLQGDLDLKNRFSKVKLNQIRGDISIMGKDLEVRAKNLRGAIGISTSYKVINLSDFAGKTVILMSDGKVTLTPAPLTHPIEVTAKNSDIKLYWPGSEKYPLEARSEGGDIQWDIPFQVDSRKENGLSQIKAFFSEVQNPAIRLATTYGTIRIEE